MTYNLLKYSHRRLRKFYRRFFYFLIPNYRFLLSKKLKCIKYPLCEQRLFLTGMGEVVIGENCSFGAVKGGFNRFGTIEIQPRFLNSKILIGSNVATNNNIFINAANYIEIGDNTLIGQNVTIMDFEAHSTDPIHRHELGTVGSIIIGKNVWIGNNVSVLKNSVVGDNSIVATGAVVSGKFPENVIIGGVPAKIIKNL